MVDISLDFDFDAEMPKSHRGGGGRSAVKWEEILDPARSKVGKAGRISVFTDTTKNGKLVTAQAQAQARIATISSRLRTVVPLEKWKFNTRKYEDGTVGLWVTFDGVMDEAEYKEVERKRQERSERIRAGKNGNSTNGSTATTAADPPTSPAAKVAAARAAKAS